MPRNSLVIALLTILVSFPALAKEESSFSAFFSNPGKKADRDYFSFGLSLNEFSKMTLNLVESESISHGFQSEDPPIISVFGLTAQTYGLSFIYGSYIDKTFKTEFRYGQGLVDGSLQDAKDVNLNHWMSLLLGAEQEITEYMNGYAMLGATYYRADVTRREVYRTIQESEITTEEVAVQPSVYVDPPNLFETNFSLTWILGLDYKLSDQWYLSFEYGRLLKDTDTDIEIDQYSTYLKFEF